VVVVYQQDSVVEARFGALGHRGSTAGHAAVNGNAAPLGMVHARTRATNIRL
jgi:hypothetical protein